MRTPEMVAQHLKVGDYFTMAVPVYRRWWQFWRPRIVGNEKRVFRITAQGCARGERVSYPIFSMNG